MVSSACVELPGGPFGLVFSLRNIKNIARQVVVSLKKLLVCLVFTQLFWEGLCTLWYKNRNGPMITLFADTNEAAPQNWNEIAKRTTCTFLEMDQKHTSGNGTVCMFFLIKLLKSHKNITERRNICQLSSYSIFVALLGQKFGTGISFSSARESGWPKAKSLIWVDHRIWFKSAMMEIERCFSSHLMDSYLSLSLSAFLDWKPFNKGNFCTNGLIHWYLRKKRTGKIR